MPPAAIRWERRAFKELMVLPRTARERIVRAVDDLADSPLKGELLSGEWQGLRRLRVGLYRVIYTFDGAAVVIAVLRAGHRSEVYR